MKRRALALASLALALSVTSVVAPDGHIFVDDVQLDASQVCIASSSHRIIETVVFEDGSGYESVFFGNGCGSGHIVTFTIENND